MRFAACVLVAAFLLAAQEPPPIQVTTRPSFADQLQARRQMLRFLSNLRADDRVAIFALDSSLRILHEFTADPDSLIRTVQKLNGRESPELQAANAEPESTGNTEIDGWLRARGWMADSRFTAQTKGNPAQFRNPSRNPMTEIARTHDSMELIARRTGARACFLQQQ
jgi:hypothetical protein